MADALTIASWPAGSRATLCRVAWDAAYRDVVRFANEAERTAYFSGLANDAITLDKMTYLRYGEPITVDVPFSRCYNYNYVVVENPDMPVPGEAPQPKLYYFIVGASFSAPNTTRLDLQLDCWQTYLFDVRFGRCFVERGHVGISASLAALRGSTLPQVASRYLTAPEGLDVGADYTISSVDHVDLSYNDGKGFYLLFCSTVDLAADWGSLENAKLTAADGQMVDGLFSGCTYYALSARNAKYLMEELRDYPWVAKGIVSIQAYPTTLLTDGAPVKLHGVDAFFVGDTPDEGVYYTDAQSIPDRMMAGVADRYRSLIKLCVYPYALIELANYQGNNVALKPELCSGNRPTLTLRAAACVSPGHTRIAFYPEDYGTSKSTNPEYMTWRYSTIETGAKYAAYDAGAKTDVALWFSDFPSFSIVNDGYLAYLAGSAHSRAYSYEAAGWGLAKANQANQLSYYQTNRALETADDNRHLENIMSAINTGVSAATTMAGGNPIGGIITAATGIGSIWAGNEIFRANQANAYATAGENYQLAQTASQGDYNMAVKAINASVQDAQITPPSIAGSIGGNGWALSNGLFGFDVRYKVMDDNHMSIIGDYFLRYGYAVQRYMVPPNDLMTCEKATYWKMLETYITCARADEGVKDVIRGVFERGVTVWRNPYDIATLDFGNNEPIVDDYY